ncbi:hypothetical protein EV426DRAFT_575140 [Tirmania nivea]|nr:hypothetical protein EV426DRAFT_575140 [Tirmania nivea]
MFFHSLSLVFLLASFLTSFPALHAPAATHKEAQYKALDISFRSISPLTSQTVLEEAVVPGPTSMRTCWKDIVMIEMGRNDMGTPGAGYDIGQDCAVLSGTGNQSIQYGVRPPPPRRNTRDGAADDLVR